MVLEYLPYMWNFGLWGLGRCRYYIEKCLSGQNDKTETSAQANTMTSNVVASITSCAALGSGIGGFFGDPIGGLIGGIGGSLVGYYFSERIPDPPEFRFPNLFGAFIPDPSTGCAAGGSHLGGKLYGAEGALLGGIAGSLAGYFGLGKAIEAYKALWYESNTAKTMDKLFGNYLQMLNL